MQTIELFCGTKSFSTVAARYGFDTFTVDIEPTFNPDLIADIRRLDKSDLLQRPFILWASPPCEAFSVAAIGKNWNRDGTPKHPRAILAQKLVAKTLSIIRQVRPTWWFIENPRGMLRTLPLMRGLSRHTVTYCQYGDHRQKPTDIWTNADWWQPLPPCSPRSACHQAAPRGSRTGTQGLKRREDRARIPYALFAEIFCQCTSHSRVSDRRHHHGPFEGQPLSLPARLAATTGP